MTESTMQAVLLAQGVPIDSSPRVGAGDALMGMMLDGPVSASMAAVLQRAEYRPATLLAPVDAKGVNDVGVRSLAVRLLPKTVD